MAKIFLNEVAPDEAVHFTLANDEFDLGGKSDAQSYETDDLLVVAAAEVHPWLRVEREEGFQFESVDTGVLRPEDDALSAVNSVAFDPEEIRKVEEAKAGAVVDRTALNAGLEQTEPVETGGVAETLAAVESHDPAKSASNFEDKGDE